MSGSKLCVAVLWTAMGVAGCSDSLSSQLDSDASAGVGASPPSKISISPTSLTLNVGERFQFIARDQKGAETSLATWSSSDTSLARVNTAGLVTAGSKAGHVIIEAKVPGRAGTAWANVTVRAPTVASVARIVVEPGSLTMDTGSVAQLNAQALDAAGAVLSGVAFNWNSSNLAVVAVSTTGQVTARFAGVASIMVSGGGQTTVIPVNVTRPRAAIASIVVTPSAIASLTRGSTQQLSAEARDASGQRIDGIAFTWSSSNSGIATVSSSGLVTAGAAGSVQIDASAEGMSGRASITITEPAPTVASITVSPNQATLPAGNSQQLIATARDASGNTIPGVAFTWSTNAATIATVTSTGTVRGVNVGAARITASGAGLSGSADVSVTQAPPGIASVAIAPASASVARGSTVQLTAQARDQYGNLMTGVTFAWASNNTLIASVASNGLVTGIAAGSTTVTVTAGGFLATATVSVTDPPVQPMTGRTFLFASDWSTATGNSLLAITDNSRWQQISDNTTMEIVTSTGLDFPTANVYRAIATAERTGWSMVRKSGMPIPAVGERRYYRWYLRLLTPDGGGNYANHPIQDGFSASSSNWMFETVNGGNDGIPNGQWRPEFWLQSGSWPNTRWRGPILNKGQTYRFEFQVHRVSETQFQMHVRIYDTAGNLLADDSNMRNDNGSLTLASNPVLSFVNVSWMDGLNAGNNGIHGTQPWPFTYAYEGGFAVCRGDWCGAYTIGEGR